MRKSPLDTRPEHRPLRIFAFDPMLARGGEHRVTVRVPYRAITRSERSFGDDRLEVVDFDSATGSYFRALDLDDHRIAMTAGLEPLEDDPQFHQQMVYAIASKVLENFDRALGRRLRFRGGDRLRLFPHAFQARNAYFDAELNAVLFGYFSADEDDPGPNLPGQLIFTCLSHDIVAHEVAHAALGRLHAYYNEPTNPQVPALHEAFADIVAMFQRLTFPEVVAPVLRDARADLLGPGNRLLDIGAQFGAASGRGGPLRRIAGKPDPALFAATKEPHALGWILVSAVYEGFVSTFVNRTRDLLRLATGGTGRLPEGELHPDLIQRLTGECVRIAQSVLSMCIRATDYLPPVDPTFSDFLRAMVTADFELNRVDDLGLRAAMIEAFRQRGIRPTSVGSLAVESLLLDAADPQLIPDEEARKQLAGTASKLLGFGALQLERNASSGRGASERKRRSPRKLETPADWIRQQNAQLEGAFGESTAEGSEQNEPEEVLRQVAAELNAWVKAQRVSLGLHPSLPVAVAGFHPVHRIAASGELLLEIVVQLVQTQTTSEDLGGLTYRAGTTLIANIDGQVRYLISKPFQEARKQALQRWVAEFDDASGASWSSQALEPNRLMVAFSARAMDRRRWR